MADAPIPEVFLSYARADAGVADAVVKALTDAGVKVWRDVTDLKGGSYKAGIVAGMRWAKAVLVLCSPHSLASPNVKAELDIAWDDLKKPVVQLWAVERASCIIPDDLLLVLSAANQFVVLHGREPDVWVRLLLDNLATHGIGIGATDLVAVPRRPPSTPLDSQSVPPPPPPPPERRLELIDTPARAQAAQTATAQRLGVEPFWTNSLGISFRLIPAGEFAFGPSEDAPDADPFAAITMAVHRPFWMATFPLTLRVIREYLRDSQTAPALKRDKLFCPTARSTTSDDLPATSLSLTDADAVCHWLSVRDGRVYWVPGELEWEYAARAGCGRMRPPRSLLPPSSVSPPDSHRVNAFGLLDVLGNVCEWTSTVYEPIPSQSSGGGSKPASAGGARTVRGGGWRTPPADVRLCWRKSQVAHRRADDLGVRLLCEVNG